MPKSLMDCLYLTCRVQEDHPIMSFTVSKNGRLALLNVATQVSLCFQLHLIISTQYLEGEKSE